MCKEKHPELKDVPEHVLDKADYVYEERHGDYDENEAENATKARSDYKNICDEIKRRKRNS